MIHKCKVKPTKGKSKNFRFFLGDVYEWMDSDVVGYPTAVMRHGIGGVAISTPIAEFDDIMDEFLATETIIHTFPDKHFTGGTTIV